MGDASVVDQLGTGAKGPRLGLRQDNRRRARAPFFAAQNGIGGRREAHDGSDAPDPLASVFG